MAEALYRKYRPQVFEDVVGQDHIVRTIKNALDAKSVSHAYLFSGPRGVGKTSAARILAKVLNCEQPGAPLPDPCNQCASCEEITNGIAGDVIEIDGASNTGVEDIRELKENVRYLPARSRYKTPISSVSNARFHTVTSAKSNIPNRSVGYCAWSRPAISKSASGLCTTSCGNFPCPASAPSTYNLVSPGACTIAT